ncbi:hypothetical protein D3P08_00375 [Paenibacillus nanensis]|uniref:Uncharacterized protein n=1 Tax=Paenibacillus nanensis TaxID=393251 RepID=A0A3A1VIF2_9BACL|nr:hypothetical protein [Paenibacillus nanensis]RIX60084.1 hypothetical protein D3P08_00375 [Paenibacillus nanensis]
MVVVLFICLAWIFILIFIGLFRKLPLVVNSLLFMAIDIVLTNKLTIIGFNSRSFQLNTGILPFIALILHNDFIVPFVLLTFANVFLATPKIAVRISIALYAFFVQLLLGLALRWHNILIDKDWNFVKESVMILLLMLFTLVLGRLFQRMARKEGWVR